MVAEDRASEHSTVSQRPAIVVGRAAPEPLFDTEWRVLEDALAELAETLQGVEELENPRLSHS